MDYWCTRTRERDGSEEAVELASTAHAVVGAEGFLAFELLLLRDAERWEDLLQAAKRANPDDRGRFETELLRARALEGSGRLAEAFAVYSDLADIEADLPWVAEAQRRREHLRTLADSGDLDIEPAEGDLRVDPYVRGADPVLADVSLPPYDHLAPYQDLPTRDDGPIPRGSLTGSRTDLTARERQPIARRLRGWVGARPASRGNAQPNASCDVG
ncbi:MAG: hypothetical protein M3Q43_00535 [Actinomycetota bacterium]|nr:hypothetical protein [Actinomycetota bacterium]